MKRFGLIIAVLAIVLSVTLPLIAADDDPKPAAPQRNAGQRGGGRGSYGQDRAKIFEVIEAVTKKMKTPATGMSRSREDYQNMTDAQRTEMRAKFTKMREDYVKSMETLQNQITKLRGARALTAEHDKEIKQLTSVHELAVKEGSKGTAAAIKKIIDEKKQAFEAMMKKLELEPRRGSTRGGRGQGQGRQRSN